MVGDAGRKPTFGSRATRARFAALCRGYFEKGNRFREVRCFFVCSLLTGDGSDAVKEAAFPSENAEQAAVAA